jgi:hypothetical protein
MDALASWINVDTGGEEWVLNGGVPEVDFNGLGLGTFSNDWHTNYAFEAGQVYAFDYSIKGSNSASVFHIEIVDASNNVIISEIIHCIPESQTGTYTFMAPEDAAGISIWHDNPASCGGECLARIVSFTNVTESIGSATDEIVTEEICIEVLEECDDTLVNEDGDRRLLEDGNFRLLE